MPPAFNLRQDQTLQFNSCFFASVPSSAPRLRSLSNGIESFLPCFHLLQCETLYFELAALLSLFPHLSVRCQVFKELLFAPLSGRQGSAYYTSPNRFASSGTSFPSLALSPLSCALCFALLRRGGESYQHFRRCQTLFSRQSDILLLSDNSSIPFSLKYKANYALCAVTDLTGGRRTRRRFLWKNSSSDENTTLSRTSGAGSSPACCTAI